MKQKKRIYQKSYKLLFAKETWFDYGRESQLFTNLKALVTNPCCHGLANCPSATSFNIFTQIRRVYTSFYACVFSIAFPFPSTYVGSFVSTDRNIITLKTQRNAENACVNGMWQLGYKGNKFKWSGRALFCDRS